MRANRWFQGATDQDNDQRDPSHFRCNVRKRAKGKDTLTHRLAGGLQRNNGYHAFLWYEILHVEMGRFGMYPFAQILQDKIARFLFELHDKEFQTVNLPARILKNFKEFYSFNMVE